jgi:uncharacterized protein with FMN-binding domain
MRRTTMALAATTTGVALIIGVKAGTGGAPRPALGGSAPAVNSSTGAAAAPPATASGSYTGSSVPTRYGTMQVQAVLKAGKLTGVAVLQQTSGGRSSEIDSYALPVLTAEALKAQGADIDVVSGATYTSDGYAQSLQAALDKAARAARTAPSVSRSAAPRPSARAAAPAGVRPSEGE